MKRRIGAITLLGWILIVVTVSHSRTTTASSIQPAHGESAAAVVVAPDTWRHRRRQLRGLGEETTNTKKSKPKPQKKPTKKPSQPNPKPKNEKDTDKAEKKKETPKDDPTSKKDDKQQEATPKTTTTTTKPTTAEKEDAKAATKAETGDIETTMKPETTSTVESTPTTTSAKPTTSSAAEPTTTTVAATTTEKSEEAKPSSTTTSTAIGQEATTTTDVETTTTAADKKPADEFSPPDHSEDLEFEYEDSEDDPESSNAEPTSAAAEPKEAKPMETEETTTVEATTESSTLESTTTAEVVSTEATTNQVSESLDNTPVHENPTTKPPPVTTPSPTPETEPDSEQTEPPPPPMSNLHPAVAPGDYKDSIWGPIVVSFAAGCFAMGCCRAMYIAFVRNKDYSSYEQVATNERGGNKYTKRNSDLNYSDDASGDWEWSDDDLNVSSTLSHDSWNSPPRHGSGQLNTTGISMQSLSANNSSHSPHGMQLKPGPPSSAKNPLNPPMHHRKPPERKVEKTSSDDDLFRELGLSARPTFSHSPPSPSSPPKPVAVPTPLTSQPSAKALKLDPEDTEYDFDDWNDDGDDLDRLLDG